VIEDIFGGFKFPDTLLERGDEPPPEAYNPYWLITETACLIGYITSHAVKKMWSNDYEIFQKLKKGYTKQLKLYSEFAKDMRKPTVPPKNGIWSAKS